jgi:predicted dehydrogenase
VYGRSAERLAGVNLPAGAKKTTRLEDILEDASVKAVLVLTPPNTHLESSSAWRVRASTCWLKSRWRST